MAMNLNSNPSPCWCGNPECTLVYHKVLLSMVANSARSMLHEMKLNDWSKITIDTKDGINVVFEHMNTEQNVIFHKGHVKIKDSKGK